MNRELEAILKSYQALKEAYASGADAVELKVLYESRLDDVLSRRPNLSRATLQQLIDYKYGLWRRAQEKPSALPPKA